MASSLHRQGVDGLKRENNVPADPVLSRELKSLRDELAAVQGLRLAQSADQHAEAAVSTGTGAGAAVESAAPAGQPQESSKEQGKQQELRSQLHDLVKEITDLVEGAEKNIAVHPAMSIVSALVLGILIGRLLGRR
jgi:ElaB/YqjD/DUF883 family membrane-anchored ribosome-binding protein